MAAERRNQVKKLRFELTWSAVAGIAVIVFCLFLWMFLLGVWAGQSLLFPSYGQRTEVSEEKGKAPGSGATTVGKKAIKKSE